ncbi:hypothetical protein MKW94_010508, partial [Papaver nudicaule]|nr:hypothetical protein [Papaver nudicaule]
LLEHTLSLPADSSFPHDFVVKFNEEIHNILRDQRFKAILTKLSDADSSVNNLLSFLFRAISCMDTKTGFLSVKNFETASKSIHRQPKLESLQGCSILELYLLMCMKKLEATEQNSYNFNSVMKEYKEIQEAIKTSDNYERDRCFTAFEHLEQRGLISFEDVRGMNLSLQFRPVKLLVSSYQLQESLKSRTAEIPENTKLHLGYLMVLLYTLLLSYMALDYVLELKMKKLVILQT